MAGAGMWISVSLKFQSMRLPLGDEMTVDEDRFSKRLGES